MIEVRDLAKRFGKRAVLDGVSFRVGAGEAVALCGSNGAGKTTVLRCMLGLQRHEGSIRVNGLDAAREGKAARACIGYVPQELAFQDNVSVEETIGFYARLRRAGRDEVAARLREVGLLDVAPRTLGALSGGMKQRLALAIALLGDPPVLLLDEPTANLDPDGRETLLKRLVRLHEAGKTILFTSHRSDEVAALADRALLLDAGRVRAEAPGRSPEGAS